MSLATTTFRLLILYETESEAQRLISMFQAAGRPCRAQYVKDIKALNHLLEDQSWDLLIAHDATTNVSPSDAIKTINRLNLDLPALFLTDDDSSQAIIDGMKLGACDVMRVDEDQHLLLAVNRELGNREMRQDTRRALRKLKDTEKRNQQLLDSSRDGIAFVQDGMYLYANDSFAELFGYDDKDEIECMPIMDMIKGDDHDDVKRRLKEFTLQPDAISNHMSFCAKLENGNEKKLNVNLYIAQYDDESCLQFVLPAKLQNNEQLEAELETVKQTESSTGLYNKEFMLNAIDRHIDQAQMGDRNSLLSYIEIDNIESIQDTIGLANMNEVFGTVAERLKDEYPEDAELSKFNDDTFIVLSGNTSIESVIASANIILEKISGRLLDINNKTAKITLSIGIAPINDTTTDVQAIIKNAQKAIEQVRSQNELPGVGNDVHVFQQSGSEAKIIISTIQKALANNQFKLLFQPIISLRGDDVEQYEVLLRMIDDDGEEISPDNFLQTAASINACDKIDRWVILETIKTLSQHRKKGHNTRVIVNLSSSSSCDETLVPWLKVAFKAAQLPPEVITFQLKELDVTQHLNATRLFVEGIHALNSTFCISRFGCVMEPMATLNHLPVDYIKLDGSFTQELQDNPEKDEALKIIMTELSERQKITIVPLVENASILSKLWQLGVHYIQGYYLQHPANGMDYDFDLDD
ncbi:EAL domain-containing protein [bacterium]|nr:EAL domain-containing protein [bacterium]